VDEDHPVNEQGAQFFAHHELGRSILQAQARAIDALIRQLHALDALGETPLIRVPVLMLQAVGVSIYSVLRLTKQRDMAIRDCFGIARSAVETAVNAAFIAVSGASLADKAVRHMRQKRWRDLRRQGKVGDQQISAWRDIGRRIEEFPGLEEAVAEFTNKRGDEVRDWTPESLEQRIAVVSAAHRRAGLCLGVASFSIYRPASELLHGTFYGVNLFWQGSRETPVQGRDDFDELWITEHFVTLLTAMFFAVSGAIEAVACVHGLANHSAQQELLSQQLSKLIESMGTDPEEAGHHFHAGNS